MHSRKYIKVIIISLIFLALSGCSQATSLEQEISDTSSLNFLQQAEEKMKLVGVDKEYSQTKMVYYDQIERIFDADENNLFLGKIQFYQKETPQSNNGLYAIDIEENWAYRIHSAPQGYWIRDAVIGEKYIVWVEEDDHNGSDWSIFSMNRETGNIILVDSGLYNVNTGGDWPNVDIEGDLLCYNLSQKGTREMVFQIRLFDLNINKKTVIAEIEKEDNFYGRPYMEGNVIVWHRGEWKPSMNTDVYHYDINTGITKRLPTQENAIMPLIWDKYVCWTEYESGREEFKYVVQYDMDANKKYDITDHEGFIPECWRLSTKNAYMTWQESGASAPSIWDFDNQNKFKFNFECQERILEGDHLIARNRKLDGFGLYFIAIDEIK